MNLNENIHRIKQMMGLLVEEEKTYESKPIILIGTAGSGKSTTAKELSIKLGIDIIDIDEKLGSEEYENKCKGESGVEVNITRTPDGKNYGSSNDEYKLCVIRKLFENYSNQKVIFDVGGDTSLQNGVVNLFENIPNIFILGVSENPKDDEFYINKLVQSRQKRATDMGEPELENDTNKNDIQQSINKIREYYRGKQIISIFDDNGQRKPTNSLVDEIIFKLT
jgi:adenylate kinase family enzyme